MTWRQIKFALIEKLLGPAAVLLLRAIVATYRIAREDREILHRAARHQRLVVVTGHGMFPSLLPLVAIARAQGRCISVMTSPSRDGKLMDLALAGFRIRVVKGSSRSRAIPATMELISEIEQGHIGLIAVDGPRGPILVPKPGFFTIARRTNSHVVLIVTSCDRSIGFGSWDRLFLPLPFSRIRVTVRDFDVSKDAEETQEQAVERLGNFLRADSIAIDSPVARGEKASP